MARVPSTDSLPGLLYAVSAYCLWGFLPIYIHWLQHVPPAEVVAHRVLWSIPVAGLVLLALGRMRDLRAAFATPRTLAMGVVTATLITVNWTIYVWAVTSDRAIDAALGYYINPLFSVALGALFLGERLTKLQLTAIGLALIAVIYLTVDAGGVPWAAVGLTLSWGFYAFFKKELPVGPNQGFLLEVLLIAPFALGYLVWLGWQGTGIFGPGDWDTSLLLMAGGIVTAVPLMLYANGAKGLRLSTIGILQYIAPTLIFLVAVFVLGEAFDAARRVAFPLIWAALVLYSWSMLREMRRA